jgi:ABC-2 type transport system ATP-binding protein
MTTEPRVVSLVEPAISVSHLSHCYGERTAVDDLSLTIERGEIFAFLGPNGGGKTTLFRVLSTLIPVQRGEARVLGFDLRSERSAVRSRIGVVFQAPSLDKKLTVAENLRHQGHLYGLRGNRLASRMDEMLDRLGVADRRSELCEKLSGGLRRRVELAKGMLHEPRLLLLDEPSTGLDPAARADMWNYLRTVRDRDGVTVVLTTHLLEEADKADRIAILSAGKLVALDTPDALRATVGGDSITIRTADVGRLSIAIHDRFQVLASVIDGAVRLEQPNGHEWIARLVEAFPGQIEEITLGKPTLEDVFIARTGHTFWEDRIAS